MPRRSPRALGLVAGLLVLASATATGCGGPSQPGELVALPAGSVTVEVVQERLDWGRRVISLVISVPDDAAWLEPGESATVTAASLGSAAWTGSASLDAERTVTIAPGRTRSMFVQLGEPVCTGTPPSGPDAAIDPAAASDSPAASAPATGSEPPTDPASDPAVGTAHLTLTLPDGTTAEASSAVVDAFGHLARAHGEDCAAAAFATGATLQLDGAVGSELRDGELVGSLGVDVERVPGGPEVVVQQIRGTQLMKPLAGEAWVLPDLQPVPDGISTVELPFTAVRCDPHAIAEDKRGTYVGIDASVAGVDQPTFYVRLDDAARRGLTTYIGEACEGQGS